MVSLRLLRGELSALRHEYIHLLKNVPLTQKLGFPDVIMPGDVRYTVSPLIIHYHHYIRTHNFGINQFACFPVTETICTL